jgi:hypothetical protein
MEQLSGAEWTAAVQWAVAAGAREHEVRARWRADDTADVPIGHLWDVVRVIRDVGGAALDLLHATGNPCGPVLDTRSRGVLEFLVPPGTATNWTKLTGTTCASSGHLCCPAPGYRVHGRRWLLPPPGLIVPTTSAVVLRQAITVARNVALAPPP